MFGHCTLETMPMCWLKRNLWKIGIAIAGMLLLLVLIAWLPVSAAGAREMTSGLATPITATVQATPTVDATVAALNKEKLAEEIKQLKDQNEPDLFSWLRTNAAILLSTLVVVIGGLIGYFRWLGDRRDEYKKRREDQRSELEKRAEERFQAAVTKLEDEKEGTRIGAAILLRTFLRPGYEQFYIQTFDLAVANLRPQRTSTPSEDPNTSLPLTTLRQVLIVVFKEAFPLARSQNKGSPHSLDATGIQLDHAYMAQADLNQAWMPKAFLRNAILVETKFSEAVLEGTNLNEADLSGADLSGAVLEGANLNEADLSRANLSGAVLWRADLSGANLSGTNLSGASFSGANLSGADLSGAGLIRAIFNETDLSSANLSGATLKGVDLSRADLSSANLSGADLSGADLSGASLNGADLSGALLWQDTLSGAVLSWTRTLFVEETTPVLRSISLKDTDLRGVKGLTKEQLEACKAKGAIIDEDSTASSSQSTIPSPLPSQSNDGQAQSPTSAQGSMPTPVADDSSAPSSKLNPES